MGRNPTRVGGRVVDVATALHDGDLLTLPGATLQVKVERVGGAPAVSWWVRTARGASYGVTRSPLIVGGGPADDLGIEAWPPGALALHLAQGALMIEPRVDVDVDGGHYAAGELVAAQVGGSVVVGEQALELHAEVFGRADPATVVRETPLPMDVTLEQLADGGRLVAVFSDRSIPIEVGPKRTALLSALLAPAPGDLVVDEQITAVVWPGEPGRGREDVGRLVDLVRLDLLRAGLNPFRVLERAPSAGVARFGLAPGGVARVVGPI